MPIHGLSEVRRMPRVGKLRLGIKATSKKTGNQFPKAVDYFVCNADASTSAEAAQAFRAVYGGTSLDLWTSCSDRRHDAVFPSVL